MGSLPRCSPRPRRRLLSSGGGPTGVEAAGELGEYLNGRVGWFGSKSNRGTKVEIMLVTAGERILPILRHALARKAEVLLEKVGVTVVKNSRVVKVEPEDAGLEGKVDSPVKVTLQDGTVVAADLYVPATGTKPNTLFLAPELLMKDERVHTNPETLRVEKAGARVYALGDVSSAGRPAVHNILEAVPVLCGNLKRDLLLEIREKDATVSVPLEKVFKADDGETQLVPIGTIGGVGALKGWKIPGFLVWAIKGRDYWLWTTPRLWSGKQWEKE